MYQPPPLSENAAALIFFFTSSAPHSGQAGVGSDRRTNFSKSVSHDWQTYSYRGTAPPPGRGRYRCDHTRWQVLLAHGDLIELVPLLLLIPLGLLIWGWVPALAGAAVQATELGTPFRLSRRTLAVVAREGAVRAVVRLISPFGRPTEPVAQRRAIDSAVPVLLLASPPANRAALAFLTTFLTHRGVRGVHAAQLAKAKSLDALAQHVGKAAERLAAACESDRVDIVAHGITGLAAAWWIHHHDGSQHVRRLITLGTPWRGTRMAVFQRNAVARALTVDAAALDDLAPCSVPVVAIGSPDDPFVVPAASAFPDGAVHVVLDGAGHTDLLLSARTFRAVHTALTQPMGDPHTAEPA